MKNRLVVWGIIFICTFIVAIPAYAIQVPLEISMKRAYPVQSDNITLVSYQATLRVRPTFTSVDTFIVIRNDGPSEANITVGIPSKYDDVVTVKQPSVIVEGQSQKLTTLRASQPPQTSDIFLPPYWSTFTVKLTPGQSKVIKSSFTIDNKFNQDELRFIYFPLKFLNFWKGPINYIQITADLDFYPLYVFEPNPSVMPSEYDTGGRLVWRFLDVRQVEDLQLYFYPVELAVASYLKQKAQGNNEVINIVNLYQKMDYDDAIASIDEFLLTNPTFELSNELKYLKALCHMELYQPGMAMEIFEQLQNSPGFAEPLSNVIRNKMIYDRVYFMKLMGKEDEILDYLKEIQPSLKNNAIFKKWVEDEIKRLSPLPPPPQETEEMVDETVDEQAQSSNDQEDKVNAIEYIDILGYDVPVELIFIGILLLIIIVYMIRRRRNKKKKRYIF